MLRPQGVESHLASVARAVDDQSEIGKVLRPQGVESHLASVVLAVDGFIEIL